MFFNHAGKGGRGYWHCWEHGCRGPPRKLSPALGRRHIPGSPLLRVKGAVFAAVVGNEERGERKEREVKELCDGVVLWREEA